MKFDDIEPGMIIGVKNTRDNHLLVAKKDSERVTIVSIDGAAFSRIHSKEWDNFFWSSLDEVSNEAEKRDLIANCFESKSLLDKIVRAWSA